MQGKDTISSWNVEGRATGESGQAGRQSFRGGKIARNYPTPMISLANAMTSCVTAPGTLCQLTPKQGNMMAETAEEGNNYGLHATSSCFGGDVKYIALSLSGSGHLSSQYAHQHKNPHAR